MIRLADRIDAARSRDTNIWLHRESSENQSYLIAAYRGMVPSEEIRAASPVVTCEICRCSSPRGLYSADCMECWLCAECAAYLAPPTFDDSLIF